MSPTSQSRRRVTDPSPFSEGCCPRALFLKLGTIMTDSDIDASILAVVEASWRKVAMIVAKAAEILARDLPDEDDTYDLIARRIEVLVHDGRLVAKGDLKQWRHSEVRRP
jgi:hypothetical protein